MHRLSEVPRPEYPRPHRVRPRWLNLNGVWEFAFDDADRGRRDGWYAARALPLRIVVPYCVEAPLSGIGERAIRPIVWYRRSVDIPADYLRARLLLHIGACDFAATVWLNGQQVATHRGGYAPITCELQPFARAGTNTLIVRAEDRPEWTQPRGKQIVGDRPEGIDYDRVTGIWQTVWLEPVPDIFLEDVWSHFRLTDHRLTVHLQTSAPFSGRAAVTVSHAGAPAAAAQTFLDRRSSARLELAIPDPRLWTIETPTLYDVVVVLEGNDGRPVDRVQSYAGLREFTCNGREVLLNGRRFYFRGVLDQGYFPDGWYTAASDADLQRDVELIRALGFNGVRKHQKAEDPRWLMWADHLGLAVWGETGSGRVAGAPLVEDFTREWLELVRRDRMHPSIMAWVPLNESWGVDAVARSPRQQAWVRALYELTRALDGTRPVVANDGWQYFVGDIWGIHNYVPDAAFLAHVLDDLLRNPTRELAPGRAAALPGADVTGVPVMLTEFGGLAWRDPDRADAGETWGYEVLPDRPAFESRLRALVTAVRERPALSGFVWTQLTDVQQEANGLLTFARHPKLELETYRSIFGE